MELCVADTQAATGYMLQQALDNEFRRRGIDMQTATLVTRVEVRPDDPAFRSPSKPIGSFMEEDRARTREREDGWHVVEDAGRGWRRVVPSPIPQRVVEESAIKQLVDGGTCVIAVGGGGIPVVVDRQGDLQGVPAVIDKDLACAVLANRIGAELLIISTAVERVALNFGKPDQRWIDRLTVTEAARYLAEGTHFGEGSMAPKIQACIGFLEGGGKRAIITDPGSLARALRGEKGTHIVP